jgi:hypothetical protein
MTRAWLGRAARWLGPDVNPGGVIYGVLTVGTLLAAESSRRETYGAVVASSCLALALYWIADTYAHHLGNRLERPSEWTPAEIVAALAHEAALLKGALLPILATVIAWAVGANLETGVTAALWTAGVELLALEVTAGVRRRLPLREMVAETVVGASLGGGILGLRLLLH